VRGTVVTLRLKKNFKYICLHDYPMNTEFITHSGTLDDILLSFMHTDY
jgi:hypothetical protein